MKKNEYIMESDREAYRLDLKTDSHTVKKQALWAGIKQGMRVADIGFGSGKTTFLLHQLVSPGGRVVGVDRSEKRLKHARNNYHVKGLEFICQDILELFDSQEALIKEVGMFDFIWTRFFLEYHRKKSFDIVKKLSTIMNPGGIICLIDLDYNCLNHFGLSKRLERSINGLMDRLEAEADFDPYIGRKLYSFLYDLGYNNIDVIVDPHHLIFGELEEKDRVNWEMKVEVAAKNSGYAFEEYNGEYEEFLKEFKIFFSDPRRFTYTPVISCRGQKPL